MITPSTPQINAVTNSTCLIVTHDTYISVFDFWNEDIEEASPLESVKLSAGPVVDSYMDYSSICNIIITVICVIFITYW